EFLGDVVRLPREPGLPARGVRPGGYRLRAGPASWTGHRHRTRSRLRPPGGRRPRARGASVRRQPRRGPPRQLARTGGRRGVRRPRLRGGGDALRARAQAARGRGSGLPHPVCGRGGARARRSGDRVPASRDRRGHRVRPPAPPCACRRRAKVRGPARPAVTKKLVLAVIDALKPEMLDRAVEAGRAPALAKLIERGTYVRDCVSTFPSVTPVAAATIATGVGPAEHHIPSMNWFHRGEGRYVEYGSSFEASRTFGIVRSLQDTVYNMNLAHLS